MRAGINKAANPLADTLLFGALESHDNNEYVIRFSVVDAKNVLVSYPIGVVANLTADVAVLLATFIPSGQVYVDASSRYFGWPSALFFDPYVGVPVANLVLQLPFDDFNAVVVGVVQTSLHTISVLLRSLLGGEKERLFLFFRDGDYSLLASTHGKYFSHSDLDFSQINVISASTMPIASFVRYMPWNCTDPTIREAATVLFNQYGGWRAIPEVNAVYQLQGETYWVRSQYLTLKV